MWIDRSPQRGLGKESGAFMHVLLLHTPISPIQSIDHSYRTIQEYVVITAEYPLSSHVPSYLHAISAIHSGTDPFPSIMPSSSQSKTVTLPSPQPNQTYVTISALDGGHLTLPEKLFVTEADPSKRATVPSLAFLIQHPGSSTSSPTATTTPSTLVFDLGIKRDITQYRSAQQTHIAQRQPVSVTPDVSDSLRAGGLEPSSISTVILSHVHWDHVGTPSDFTHAEFVVGSGTLNLLAHGGGPLYPAELFNAAELPRERTRELPPTPHALASDPLAAVNSYTQETHHKWSPLAGFPAVIDFFGDGSLYIVDAPGHLTGHVNLLARTGPGKWVYLGGDCCHDARILSGERGIAMYDDGRGGLRSVHLDTDAAAETVRGVARLFDSGVVKEEGGGEAKVEVVIAHDGGWREANRARFWPGTL